MFEESKAPRKGPLSLYAIATILAAILGGYFFYVHDYIPEKQTKAILSSYNWNVEKTNAYSDDVEKIMDPYMKMPDDASFTQKANIATLHGVIQHLQQSTNDFTLAVNDIDTRNLPGDFLTSFNTAAQCNRDMNGIIAKAPVLDPRLEDPLSAADKAAAQKWADDTTSTLLAYSKQRIACKEDRVKLKQVALTHNIVIDADPSVAAK